MEAQQRRTRIEAYARGPARLKEALSKVPAEARKWRPGEGRWSVHEIVCHCADSESHASLRIRTLLVEKDPLIQGYDQAEWARILDYHELPLDRALETVEAVRGNTVGLLKRIPEELWGKPGRHTESGPFTPETWLTVYSEHLENHAGQIERTLAAWRSRKPGA